MADVRATLAGDFADIADGAAERLLDALDRDEIDPHVIRALANVAGLSVDKLVALADRLEARDDTGDSVLDRLATGFAEWAEHVANTDQNTTSTTNSQEDA